MCVPTSWCRLVDGRSFSDADLSRKACQKKMQMQSTVLYPVKMYTLASLLALQLLVLLASSVVGKDTATMANKNATAAATSVILVLTDDEDTELGGASSVPLPIYTAYSCRAPPGCSGRRAGRSHFCALQPGTSPPGWSRWFAMCNEIVYFNTTIVNSAHGSGTDLWRRPRQLPHLRDWQRIAELDCGAAPHRHTIPGQWLTP